MTYTYGSFQNVAIQPPVQFGPYRALLFARVKGSEKTPRRARNSFVARPPLEETTSFSCL